MVKQRLYRCPVCSMFYWGQELIPGARRSPQSLRVKCPTPDCHGHFLAGQQTPGEVSRCYAIVIFVLVFGVLYWFFKWRFIPATETACVTGVLVWLISWRLHQQPDDPGEDQMFAAIELAKRGEALHQAGRLQKAKWAYERAFAILGTGVNWKLEASIIGRLANVEKEFGDFTSALRHYEIALDTAERFDDASDLINRLNNIAALLGDDLHAPTEAIPYVKRAVLLARTSSDPARLALMLCHLAKRTRETGSNDQAREHAGEAITIAHAMGKPEILAEALYERSCISMAEGHNTEAAVDLKQALERLGTRVKQDFRQHLIKALDAVEAAILNDATVQLLPPGQIAAYDDFPELLDDIPQDALKAMRLGLEHLEAGRLMLAADCLIQALEQDCVQNTPKAKALAAMNLGDTLRELGRVNEALAVLRDAAALVGNMNSPRLECGLLLNLGLALRVAGRWAESYKCLERALGLSREGDNETFQGRILLALGNLYRDSLEFQSAEERYRQAEKLARQVDDRSLLGSACQSLGNLCFKQRRWRDALPHYESALELARQTRDPRLQGIVLHMMGNVHRRLGDLQRAQEMLRQSVAMADSCPSELGLAGRLNDLASVEHEFGQLDQARNHYQQSTVLYRKHSIISPDVAGSLANLGVSQMCSGDVSAARDHILEASVIDNEMISEAFAIASEDARLDFLSQAQARLNALMSLVAKGGPLESESSMVRACADVVIQRKGVTLEALALLREVTATGSHPEIADAIRELTRVKMELAQLTLAGESRLDGSLTFQAAALTARKRQLEQQISQHFPEVALDERLRQTDRQVIRRGLPEGSLLVEFLRFECFDYRKAYWRPARYAAFVMPAGEPDTVEMIDLGEAEPIDRMIATFRSSITGEEEDRSDRGLGRLPSSAHRVTGEDVGAQLREAIFTPLLKAIGNHKRLMISPDGDLTRLPFEVLPMDDGRRLIDEYQISYLGAGRDVVRFGFKSNRKPARSLVAADPDFDLGGYAIATGTAAGSGRRSRDLKREAMDTFDRLPGTKLEGENIAAMLDAELWMDSEALDARLKKCQSPRILHLATHGFFLEDQKRDPNEERLGLSAMSLGESGMERFTASRLENPLLRSGLVLAGVNTWLKRGELMEEAEDGLLTAEDVSGLDLLDTELVVLSACDTGLGEVRVGEGVFGLRRAFVLAGAKTLVMSLWKVPDEQTRELMEDFYRRILGADGEPTQSRADALRKAQLTMKAKYPEPRYWGAFICQGDPGPLLQFG